MLVFEIAAGVFLGILAYRGLDAYSRKSSLTMPAAIFSIIGSLAGLGIVLAVLGLVAVCIYSFVTHPDYLTRHRSEVRWGIGLVAVFGFGLSLRSDIMAGKQAKRVAARCICEKCGEVGLTFRRFWG
jgi:hypothetical protein